MPELTVTTDEIQSEDELWSLLKDLNADGWVGGVQVGTVPSDPNNQAGFCLQMHLKPSPENVGGITKSIEARIGYTKILVGGVLTAVLSPEQYDAAYGGL